LGILGGLRAEPLLRQIDEDRARFEHAHRLGLGTVEQSRDLRIRIDGDKAAAELVALADPDQPGVVFGAAMAERQQLFQRLIGRLSPDILLEIRRIPS